MRPEAKHPPEENTRLRRCINDLVGVLALPAIWSGREPDHMVETLLDALFGMLGLDLVCARVADPAGGPAIERIRVDPALACSREPVAAFAPLARALPDDPRQWPPLVRCALDGQELTVVPVRLGLYGELGGLFAASSRPGFPDQAERLILSVAANQLFIGLQEARLLDEQIAKGRRTEEALRASQRDLRAVIDCIPGLAAILAPTGDVEIANQEVLDYFGKTLAELRQWGTSDAIHPEDLPHVRDVFSRSVASGTPYEILQRFRRFDGVHRWFVNRGLPLRDGNGQIVHWYVLLTDIDERKRIEEALRRSEAFLAKGQRISATGTFSWRLTNDDIRWTEELYRIFEFPDGVPVTLPLIQTRIHPDDMTHFGDFVQRARAGASSFEYDQRLLMPDGSVKHIHLVGHATRDPNDELEYIGAAQDVSERRRSDEALSKVRSELGQMARVMSLGVLTASIAHEVNQPLAGIITNASTCLRFLAADPPNVDGARETARRTIRDGNRASEVITRLRALFAKKTAATESVDLNEATREVIALSLSDLQRGRVLLRTELADDLDPVTGDRIQLQQVILNLLRNAIEAMSGVEDRPRQLVIRTERADDDRVSLSVQDAGVGLETRSVERLFEPFFTTKSGGMGIGLSVSRSIIESHQGRLWAEANDGPGTTFAFSIPTTGGVGRNA